MGPINSNKLEETSSVNDNSKVLDKSIDLDDKKISGLFNQFVTEEKSKETQGNKPDWSKDIVVFVQKQSLSSKEADKVYKHFIDKYPDSFPSVILSFGHEERKIPVFLLQAKSQTFEDVFSDISTKNADIIPMEGRPNPVSNRIFVDYLAGNFTEVDSLRVDSKVDQSIVLDLLYLSHYYNVPVLKRECFDFIKKQQMNENEILDYFNFLKKNQIPELKSIVLNKLEAFFNLSNEGQVLEFINKNLKDNKIMESSVIDYLMKNEKLIGGILKDHNSSIEFKSSANEALTFNDLMFEYRNDVDKLFELVDEANQRELSILKKEAENEIDSYMSYSSEFKSVKTNDKIKFLVDNFQNKKYLEPLLIDYLSDNKDITDEILMDSTLVPKAFKNLASLVKESEKKLLNSLVGPNIFVSYCGKLLLTIAFEFIDNNISDEMFDNINKTINIEGLLIHNFSSKEQEKLEKIALKFPEINFLVINNPIESEDLNKITGFTFPIQWQNNLTEITLQNVRVNNDLNFASANKIKLENTNLRKLNAPAAINFESSDSWLEEINIPNVRNPVFNFTKIEKSN